MDDTSSDQLPSDVMEISDNEEDDIGFNCEPVVRNFEEDEVPIPTRARMSDSIRELGIRLNSRRKATQNVAIQGFASSYIDQDNSGTYDPKLGRATPPIKRVKKPKVPRPGGQPVRQKATEADSLVLNIKFTSKAGRDYLASIAFGVSGITNAGSSHGSKNTRRAIRRNYTNTRTDGLTIDQLTDGHPQRRGCIGCFEQGNDECSLIEDPRERRCTDCAEVGRKCERIIPLKIKPGCERCRRKRLPCSFRQDGGEDSDTCNLCDEAGSSCVTRSTVASRERPDPVSKPKSKDKPQTIALAVPTPDPALKRVWVACNECRSGGLRCNLKRGQDGPCTKCRKAGGICTFQYQRTDNIPHTSIQLRKCDISQGYLNRTTPIPSNHLIGTPYTEDAILTATLQSDLKRPKKGNTNQQQGPTIILGRTLGITHTHITTYFCHPIKFNYIPDPSNTYPCSWCASPVFGLWGLGRRENVEVIPWGGDLGNEEIDNGHAWEGKENSRMCVRCTCERVNIMMCANHEICALAVQDKRLLEPKNIEKALVKMSEGNRGAGRFVRDVKWCSICVAPATWWCCAGEEQGCGLLLCEICNDLLERILKGVTALTRVNVLDRLVGLWRSEEWMRDDGEIRADVGFLVSGGELMVRWVQGMGVSRWDDLGLEGVEMERRRGGRLVGKNGLTMVKGRGEGKDVNCESKEGPSSCLESDPA